MLLPSLARHGWPTFWLARQVLTFEYAWYAPFASVEMMAEALLAPMRNAAAATRPTIAIRGERMAHSLGG